MGNYTTAEIVIGFLYVTGALLLLVAAYLLYLKRFKRNKLEAMNNLQLETSLDNIFKGKTQFLIIAPKSQKVTLELQNSDELGVDTLIENEVIEGHHPISFDAGKYEDGKYFLYLKADNTKILRRITISK